MTFDTSFKDRQYYGKYNTAQYATVMLVVSVLIYYYSDYISERNRFHNFIATFEDQKMDDNFLCRINSSQLYALIGLKYERNCDLNFDFKKDIFTDRSGLCCLNILNSIKCYQRSCNLNQYDGLLQHNLGWLFYLNNQQDSAMYYISKAVELSANTALYHVSKGLMLESINFNQAVEEYKSAIMLSPDLIDSVFFSDFRVRQSKCAISLLENAYCELQKMQEQKFSSIIEAKIGKLLLSLNKYSEAYRILSDITKRHPSLSRPWYYLGVLELKKGNYEQMKLFFKKSHLLNPLDYLPLYGLSVYYNQIGDTKNTKQYHVFAEKKWRQKKSVHATLSKRMYFLPTIKDDIIPKGLLDYISPSLKIDIYDKN